MRWALLICAVFWAGVVALTMRACSEADSHRVPHVERPPARYIQPEQSAFVHFLPPAKLAEVCGENNLACASVGGANVWMPHPCDYPREGYAALLCHELGHLNNWPAEHPR